MLRDAGLNFDAKGWHVKRYHLCGSQPVCRVRRHAVEKASRRWRGGRRDDFHTGYHDEEAVGGKHNKAGWMDNIGGGASKEELEEREARRTRERGEGGPPAPDICEEQPRGDEAV